MATDGSYMERSNDAIMGLKQKIKRHRLVRGLYFLYKAYFGYRQECFGQMADNVLITPPHYCLESTKFVYR